MKLGWPIKLSFVCVMGAILGMTAIANAQASVEITLPQSVRSAPVAAVPNWSQILEAQGAKDILFGVKIAGPSPYERNSSTVFLPASNTKLFTAAFALDELGLDYQFITRMSWKRAAEADPSVITELKFEGAADPTAGMSEFGEDYYSRVRLWAHTLSTEGVKEIQGDILFKSLDSRWDELTYPEGWEDNDRYYCYGALPQSFNFNVNCALLVVSGPKTYSWTEPSVPVDIKLSIVPAKKGEATDLTVLPLYSTERVPTGFEIRGKFAKGGAPEQIGLPVHRASQWMKNLLAQALKEQAIQWNLKLGGITSGNSRVREFLSPPLKEILKPFLKDSVNLIGEILFQTVGARVRPDGKLKELAIQANQEWLAHKSLNAPEVRFLDGSGVSRKDQVTTGVVMSLLEQVLNSSYFSVIWDSLPIAGVDGTLKNRMLGTRAQGVLRAKTGTLRGVYNLSGYVPSGSANTMVPFVILSQTDADHRIPARDAQDRIGAALTEFLNPLLPRIW